MAKIQNKAKRVLAIAIALMMVLGACFTGIVTASAEGLAEGLTAVATVANQGYAGATITDIEGGGVTYTTTGMGAYKPYLHNVGTVAFPGNGVSLQFDGFVTTSPASNAGSRGYQALLIVLSNKGSSAGETCRLRSDAVPGFVIDMYNGNVDYVKGVSGGQSSETLVQRVIENNDAIKYDKMTNKAFNVIFTYDVKGDIVVSIAIEGTVVASGVLDAAKFASVANTETLNTFFSVSSLDCNNQPTQAITFNYYGFKELAQTPGFAEGANILHYAKNPENDMKPTSDSTVGGYAVTSAQKWGVVEPITGGGIAYKMFQHAGLGPVQYKVNVGGYDGNWEFILNNYQATGAVDSANYGKFAITLNGTANESRIIPKALFVAVDTIAGEAYLAKANDDVAANGDGRPDATYITKLATLSTNDALKLENLQGKAIIVTLTQTADASKVELGLIVGGVKCTSVIDKALLQNTGSQWNITSTYCFPAVCGLYSTATAGNNQVFINVYGHRASAPGYITESREEAKATITTTVTTADNDFTATANSISNIAGGGVHYEGIGHYPFELSENMDCWPGNGFKLAFANYAEKSNNTDAEGYGQFVVFFNYALHNNTTYGQYWKGGNVGININTVDGQVELVKSDMASLANTKKYVQKVLAKNDMFLYENFTGKPFTYEIAKAPDGATGDAKVTITVGDASVDFIITYAEFSLVPEGFTTNQYYARNTWDGTTGNCSVNFSALLHDGTTASVDFMGYTKDLSAAVREEARAEALEKIKVVASTATLTDGNKDNGSKTVTDYAEGGIHYEGTGYAPYFPTYNFGGYPGDGFKLSFANYVDLNNADGNAKKFALILSNTTASKSWKGGNVMIVIDGQAGQVDIVKCYGQQLQWKTIATLIDDDAFLYDNFTNKAFSFEFMLSGRKTNEVQMNIDLAGTIYTAYIDYDVLMAHEAEDGTDLSDYFEADPDYDWFYPTASTLYVGFSAFDNDAKCSVDYLGYTDGIAPKYIEDAKKNVEVLASLATTPDGRVNSNATETDLEGGGIAISGLSGYDPYNLAYNFGGWPGDGLKLQFANFVTTNTADNNAYKFALMLGNTASANMQAWKGGNVSIVINGQNGTVELVKCYTEQLQWKTVATLIEDDAFLYENFTGKVFSFAFELSGRKANEVKLTVEVGTESFVGYIDYNVLMAEYDEDGTDFSSSFLYNGEMTARKFYYPTATNLYVGFGGMDNDSRCDFYFLGYTDGITPEYITEVQNSVENKVTVENNAYTSGTPGIISDINGGGVHYNGIGHYPFQLDASMNEWPGNGFKLQFANYAETSNKTDAAGYGQFVVFFNYAIRDNTTYGPFWKGGNVGININTVDGQVELVKSDYATLGNTQKYVQKVLAKDDMFLYENFAGSVFSYEILPAGYDNAARVIITVGDNAVSFVITYEELSLKPEGFGTNTYYPLTSWDGKTGNCNVSFSALLHDGTSAAVDFFGYTKYSAGALSVGSTSAAAYEEVSVPVNVTTEAEQTMTIEVKADAEIAEIVAADGVEIDAVIDGTTAIVNVLSAVAGTDVKLFDVKFITGEDTIYTVEVNVVADAEGNKPSIRGAKGGVIVAESVPEFVDVKKQATEGAYKIGTLGFATSTAALAASVGDSFVAIEFGTVFFTQKMLGEQELVIGTKAANGAQAITVSKTLASSEELPEQFIAILKDKASNTSGTVSEAYANTTFVARSFVKFMDTDTGAIFIVYGDTFAQKLVDLQ